MQHLQVERSAGSQDMSVEKIPGRGTRGLQLGRRTNDDGAARVQDQFTMRDFDVERDDRVAESVNTILAQGGRWIDDEAVMAHDLPWAGAWRHVNQMLGLDNGLRIVVVRPVAHIELHELCSTRFWGSMRVWTRCGASSVRLK